MGICVFALVNSVAINWHSTIAISFGTILACILLWALVSIPFTALGSYRGSLKNRHEYPCKPKIVERKIPSDLPWHSHPAFQIFISGALPFIAIYGEVNAIFAAVWGHQWY